MDIYEQITKNVFGLQDKILKASKVEDSEPNQFGRYGQDGSRFSEPNELTEVEWDND